MLRRLLAPAVLLIALGACSRQADPTPSVDAAPTAAVEASPAAVPVPAANAPADTAATPAAGDASGATADAATPPAPATAPAAAPAGPAPRPGVDFEVLETPQPMWSQQPKIEIAEVFSYRCIHCAEFQPHVNAWRKTQPADTRWEYVPGVFGGAWDDFARAFFAAQVLGIRESTHDKVFHGVFVDQYVKTGTPDEIATMYARWGVDKAQFLGTMQSFGVTAKLNQAKQFALRTGVSATPTLIINGKYRVNVTTDRGFDGMLKTVDWVVARERAGTPPGAP
ncbi:hypothetical protein BH11PSE14_BH11PSE14_18950 [soil metagenome]